ncbi:MAG: hypothetical protein R3B45_12955 [Bdellovibrionota bacterium]
MYGNVFKTEEKVIFAQTCWEGTGIFYCIKMTYFIFALFTIFSLIACGNTDTADDQTILLDYSLSRTYTGQSENILHLEVGEDSLGLYDFSISNTDAFTEVSLGTLEPLVTQDISFQYDNEGVYSVDFKVQNKNGQPIIFEAIGWEYSLEVPDTPVISFATPATNIVANKLLVSSSRSNNTSEIWVGGDLSLEGKAEIEEDGFWQSISNDEYYIPITLTGEDGLKTIEAKFNNIYGNGSGKGAPASIILKQNPPTGCSAIPILTTINTNKLSVQLKASDPYELYYSVVGDVQSIVDKETFTDGEVVIISLSAAAGEKNITVSIDDIAENNCLEEDITVTIDPTYEEEGISLTGATYWTESENVVANVSFKHFPSQEPLQLKITGDVSGTNTGKWIPFDVNIPITLSPTTSGQRTIFAQYKDVDGTESYLIAKRVFLRPDITINDIGGGLKSIVVSAITGLESLSIEGCSETYNLVAYASSYNCTPNDVQASVTYYFPGDITLTKSAAF